MLIETQSTPDANVINFFPPQPILKSGQAEFVDTKSLRRSPFADMISVTKTPDASWDILKPQILAEIMDHLATGEETISAPTTDSEDIVGQIKGLLNARIRPAVKQDGGDIVFCDYRDGIVYVEMQGSCKGCPYAMRTLKDGVEKILKTYIPEVREVRNIGADGE